MKWFSARATSAIVPLLLMSTFSNIHAAEVVAPIVINTVADLQAMQNNLWGDYVLGRNIDAAGFNFTPIQGPLNAPFYGTLNGNNYTISNLTVSGSPSLSGLFADLAGSVTNLGIVNANISGGFAGTVAAVLDGGSINKSHSTGSVSSGGLGGGLVGWNIAGHISQSYSSASVGGGSISELGGLVGANTGSLMQSYAIGSVTGGVNSYVGGLVGTNGVVSNSQFGYVAGSISQSYAIGALITGTSGYVGGLAGDNGGGTEANGNNYMTSITNSYWDTSTTGRANRTGYPIEVNTNISGTQGLTTSQLKSGTLPPGFDPTIWSATPGQYPQLRLSATTLPATTLSATTAAILSNLAYKQASAIRPKDLPNSQWSVATLNGDPLEMGPNTPYHAIAFQGPDGIVIAFQGTLINSLDSASFYKTINSAFSGIGPGVSRLKLYYLKAENFFSKVKQYAQDNGLQLHLTGHSLGGGIAQMLGNNHPGIDTVTFNAPGTKTFMLSQRIMNLVATNTNIRNYRMEGDLVSLLPGENTQVGEVITIANGSGHNDPRFAVTLLDNHMCIIQDLARCNPASTPVSDLPAGTVGTTTASLYPEPVNLMLYTVATGTISASAVVGTTLVVQHQLHILQILGGGFVTWLDPTIATEYDFATGLGDPNFASVILPSQADLYDLQALVNNLWVDEGALAPLTTFDFGTGGVSQFKVFNIDPSLLDSAPFIVGVTFTGDGEFTGTVTSIQPNITTVPEPSTLGMFGLGLLLIGLFAGLRRRLC